MAPPEDEGEVPAAALRVPEHVIARVFSQLDCVDLLSCSLVCRQWFSDSAELRDEWRKEYLEAWNLQGLSFKTSIAMPDLLHQKPANLVPLTC